MDHTQLFNPAQSCSCSSSPCVFLQASRDLVCFLQLDHVNVYYGQDYRSKYKAPTDYCLALKVKYLYCHIPCSRLIGNAAAVLEMRRVSNCVCHSCLWISEMKFISFFLGSILKSRRSRSISSICAVMMSEHCISG